MSAATVGTPWENPSKRAAMVAAKEKFLGLEASLAADGDWTHDEEDEVRLA